GADPRYTAPADQTATFEAIAGVAPSSLMASAAAPSVFGQAVTWTVTVVPGGGLPGPATGVVQVSSHGTLLCASAVMSGAATCTSSQLPVGGAQEIDFAYGGDATFAPSATSVVQTVVPASTTTTVASSGSPATFGTVVTFEAQVA